HLIRASGSTSWLAAAICTPLRALPLADGTLLLVCPTDGYPIFPHNSTLCSALRLVAYISPSQSILALQDAHEQAGCCR
ncbi:hypothetical protein FB451DRAFT_1298965, partial [Mycena latifolia]